MQTHSIHLLFKLKTMQFKNEILLEQKSFPGYFSNALINLMGKIKFTFWPLEKNTHKIGNGNLIFNGFSVKLREHSDCEEDRLSILRSQLCRNFFLKVAFLN